MNIRPQYDHQKISNMRRVQRLVVTLMAWKLRHNQNNHVFLAQGIDDKWKIFKINAA